MSKRRMLSSDITNSDSFIEMDLPTQAVYCHLVISADDDGFINSSLRTIRAIGGSKEHIDTLIAKRFLIPFDSGILLVRHWKIHNQIQKDRYATTIHLNEKSQIMEINRIYYLKTEPECIQYVSSLDTQDSKDKDSTEKVNESESKEGESHPSFSVPSIHELISYAESINYVDFNADAFIAYYNVHGWINTRTNQPFDWKKLVELWKAKEKNTNSASTTKKNEFNDLKLIQNYDYEAIEEMILKK